MFGQFLHKFKVTDEIRRFLCVLRKGGSHDGCVLKTPDRTLPQDAVNLAGGGLYVKRAGDLDAIRSPPLGRPLPRNLRDFACGERWKPERAIR